MKKIVEYKVNFAPGSTGSLILKVEDGETIPKGPLTAADIAAAVSVLKLGDCSYKADGNIVHESLNQSS